MNFDSVVGKLFVAAAVLTVCRAAEVPAHQWSGGDYQNLTSRRSTSCVENEQYLHQGLCCLNCKEGTFVNKPCERDLEQGTCLSCEHGQTYTEHPNGMNRCLPCTHCRPDQIEIAPCTTTTDTQCQCRPGTFCVPDQACEVCKRCAKCKAGEEEVQKCTPVSNTKCRKRDPSPTETVTPRSPPVPDAPANTWFLVLMISICFMVVVVIAVIMWFLRKQRTCDVPWSKSSCDSSEIVKIPIDESGGTAEEKQNNQNAGSEGDESRPESRPSSQETQAGMMTKACPPSEDEDRGSGDSLPNTTSSSQTSSSASPTAASSGNTPHQSPAGFRQSPSDTDDPLGRRSVPLLGSEKSLRKSFDLFDEYSDVRIHNKFFRSIGISDNHIRIAENGPPADKVYESSKNWMQRQGSKADINDSSEASSSMDQRRSAECIAYAALRRGYYQHAVAP